MPAADQNAVGKVYLVGAGPGDPGLIAWRGVQCLGRADAVLYDYLVNPRILVHARPGTELQCLGRHGRDRIVPQAEINRRIVESAQSGRTVVRLKGGDPALFGRLAEEVDALVAAGVPFEVVPGITAALAAGSYAGIVLTSRDDASAVAVVTGRQHDAAPSPGLDFAPLATFPGTLVFYMGVTTAPLWTAALIAAGKAPDTPATIVRRCSWPDQQVISDTLGRVAEELANMRPPVIVIVGQVAAVTAMHDWFTARPLFGRRVMVTRPLDQAESLCGRLSELGAECLIQPAIQIGPPDDWGPVDAALGRLDQYDRAGAFECRCQRRASSAGPADDSWGRSAAVGVSSGCCRDGAGDGRGIGPIPSVARRPTGRISRSRIRSPQCWPPTPVENDSCIARAASRGREVLPDELAAAGAHVDQIVVYSSTDVPQADPDIAAALSDGRIDWITITSSAIARSLVAMFGDQLSRARLATISPITSATLRELGHEPAAEATEYTMDGIVQAIVASENPEN